MVLKVFKLILCDLGNVLINFDHRIAVRKIMPFIPKKKAAGGFPAKGGIQLQLEKLSKAQLVRGQGDLTGFTQKGFEEVYQLFFDSKLMKDFEEGRLTPQGFFKQLRQILGIKNMSFDRFAPIWNEIFSDNKQMAALLFALKKRHRLHLISNINKLHYDYIAEKFGRHIRLFDKCYLSYEVGFRKPHVDIYRKAMCGAGAKPHEILYIDDRADLIKEAKKLGLRPILFKNVGDLKKKLRKMKVPF